MDIAINITFKGCEIGEYYENITTSCVSCA